MVMTYLCHNHSNKKIACLLVHIYIYACLQILIYIQNVAKCLHGSEHGTIARGMQQIVVMQ